MSLLKTLFFLPLLLGAMFAQVMAESTVSIVIRAGSLESMEPPQLYSDTQYTVIVKVFNENNQPISDSIIEFKTASALINIDGSSIATTDENGVATFNLKFTAGGVVKLYVNGSSVGTLLIYYKNFPTGALSFLTCTFIIIGLALIYVVYKGPYKSLRET